MFDPRITTRKEEKKIAESSHQLDQLADSQTAEIPLVPFGE